MATRSTPLCLCLSSLLSLSGCFVERSGLDRADSGSADDAGAVDAGTDAQVTPTDARPTDTGAGCSTADERCEGNVRRYCEAGALASETCAMTEHCQEFAGFPMCVANECVPDATRCSLDMTEALVCDSIGAEETTVPCSRGCSTGGCRPETACTEDIFATMSSGTIRVDLCGAGADQTHTSACAYAEQSPAGEDVLIRLEVDRRQPIRFQARQVSGPETIDPNLSLRSACADMSSELWCREDTAGQDEDFTETLDPGDYFLVVDRHERGGTSCGVLDVTITPR